jgi:uncharacterized membrane protein YkoI
MDYRTAVAAMVLASLSLTGAAANAAETATASTPVTKVERSVAEKTALARVPDGVIKESELEREHGHLVWSFDIAQPSSANIIEVQVDAIDGKVVSVTTETPADQAREAAADRAKAHKSA